MRITEMDSADGEIIIRMDDNGTPHELRLKTMEALSLIEALKLSVNEAVEHPLATSGALEGLHHIQYCETPERVSLRIFLSEHLFHEYPVPANTTMAEDLRAFGDILEARHLARATHSTPDKKQ